MFDRDKWKEIWSTITRNRTRSVLTAFGVSWGVLMFIVLVGFGNGFRREMSRNFEGFASNSMFMYCGRTGEPYMGQRKGRMWQMDMHDVEMIRRRVTSVEYVSAWKYGSGDMVRGNKKGSYASLGVFTDYFRMITPEVLQGRLLNDMDVAESRKVCVIGQQIYETFFNRGENPLGQSIRIGSIYYQVVGVISSSSSIHIGNDIRNSVFIPLTTLQRTSTAGDGFRTMGMTARPGHRISDIEEQITSLIKANHDISPTDAKALMTINAENMVEMVDNIFSGVNLLIWVVGLGALLSGVIGISNIMLVTVRERMREIGIRRALGARPRTIVAQIMSESLVLTTLAGMAGFVAGTLLLMAIRGGAEGAPPDGLSIAPYISFNLALGAVAILVVAGLLAGLMPAWKALKIKAIDAIRDE